MPFWPPPNTHTRTYVHMHAHEVLTYIIPALEGFKQKGHCELESQSELHSENKANLSYKMRSTSQFKKKKRNEEEEKKKTWR